MRYKLLGKSGLRVSELCLGTMTFGEDWGWGASREECKKMFDLFAEAGGNFIDTANLYTEGTSEKYVGELVKSDRDYFVIATKYTMIPPGKKQHDPNFGGNHRKNMTQAVEASLRRLDTDTIDVLYLHAWDYTTPVDEVMRGFDDLIRAGKAQYIAISDTPAYIIAEGNTLAELRGWSRFVGVQVPYSLLDRAVEREILPMAKHWDMAVMPWGILEEGVLTGKYLRDHDEPTRLGPDAGKMDERAARIVQEILAIADEIGRSAAQVAINWVRQQQERALMIPILGARSARHLQDNMACLEFELNHDQLQRLDEVSKIVYGFPVSFWHGARKYIYGETYDLIDNHRRVKLGSGG